MTTPSHLKVCMVVHSVYARDPRVRRYAEYLARDGHEIDVVCLASEEQETQPASPNIKVYTIPMTRVRRGGLGQILEWAVSSALMFFRVTRLDLSRRYDVIHTNNMPDFLVFCAILPRLRGAPVIHDIHDPIPELARSKLKLSPRHPSVYGNVLLEKISILFSSHVLTATPSFKRILVDRGVPEDKITVVMNAADPNLFHSAEEMPAGPSDCREFTLLYVGTVAQRYGLETCVKALPLMRTKIPHIRLRLVPRIRDEGRDLDHILQLAKDLSVDDLITVDGPFPLERMPEIMREADLGIYPACVDCHMDVALSLKIPEMLSVGLPVIATRLTVLEDLYGEDCIAFTNDRDPQAFADKVIELFRSPELRERMVSAGRKRSKELDWTVQYKAYLNVIRELLGQPGRGRL